MIAKKYITILSVAILISASSIMSEEKKDTVTKDFASEWEKMINSFDLNTPNMKAARAAVETAGGIALCLIPQSLVIRALGLATAGFGFVDIHNNKETQVILYKTANKGIEKGTEVAHKAKEKWNELTKHISEKAKEDKK